MRFDSRLDGADAEVPVKSQNGWKRLNQNLAASRLHKILR